MDIDRQSKIKNRKYLRLRFVTFLTFVRFPLVLLFFAGAVVYANYRRMWLFILTLVVLIASALTDIFDGFFARRFNVETKFGAHVDPLMDKLFYLKTLPILVFVATKNGHMAHAIFLLVLTLFFLMRDQWVTFLRSIGSIYDASGSANWWGKLRTCINFPLICTIYHFEESPRPLINAWFLHFFEIVGFAINIISLFVYTRRYWPYLRKSVNDD